MWICPGELFSLTTLPPVLVLHETLHFSFGWAFVATDKVALLAEDSLAADKETLTSKSLKSMLSMFMASAISTDDVWNLL